MKKLILLVSVAAISLNAATDWMSDLDRTLSDPRVKAAAKRAAELAQENAPTIRALGAKYGPAIANIAQDLANEGQTLLAKVPADHRAALINQAQNLVAKAAALAQAQAQNNPEMVLRAREFLTAHTKELDMVKARAVEALRNKPALVTKIKLFVDKAKDAAGDSAIMTYVTKTEDAVMMDVE